MPECYCAYMSKSLCHLKKTIKYLHLFARNLSHPALTFATIDGSFHYSIIDAARWQRAARPLSCSATPLRMGRHDRPLFGPRHQTEFDNA